MTTKNTDQIVIDLLNKVKEKRKSLEKKQKAKWITSCTIGYNPNSVTDRINIQTVSDINILVDICAFLQNKEQAFNRARETLQVDVEFSYMGYSVQDWITDLKTRIDFISINTEKKELAALEARIDKLVTNDQRREIELEEILKLVK